MRLRLADQAPLVAAVAGLVLAACAPAAPAPLRGSSEPSARISVLASVSAPTPVASEATTIIYGDFRRDAVVSVVAEGLTVHAGPGAGYEQVRGIDVALGAVPVGDPYVLNVGERIVIQDGPLRVDGSDWYSVRAADLPDPGDTIFAEGWVAAGPPGAGNLALLTEPRTGCCYSAAGSGRAVSPPVQAARACQAPSLCAQVIAWAAAAPDPSAQCRIRISREGSEALLVADEEISGWERGGAFWPGGPGAVVVIDGDCTWSVHIGPA